MTDLLLITTLDVIGRQNNREHHVIMHYKAVFDTVTVVYRMRRPASGTWRNFFVSSTNTLKRDSVTYCGVDPSLNPPDGTVRGFSGPAGKPSIARRSIAYLLDTIAIARDAMSILGLYSAARKRVTGSNTVCLAFGPWAAKSANMLRRNGIIEKYVFVDRDYEPGFMVSHPRRLWAKWAENGAACGADLTLSIGSRLAQRFAHLKSTDVRVSPTGVDIDFFTAAHSSATRSRLVFIGEIAPWSGCSEALDALRILKDQFPDIQLAILGPALTNFATDLKSKTASLQLDDSVFWYGERPRSEVAEILSNGGIGLAVFRPTPLRIHAAPLKVLEYMASGLPVLALEGSQAGDLVEKTRTGLTCPNTPNGIAEAATKLLNNQKRYLEMSERGPQAAEEFGWSCILERELDTVGELYGLKLTPPQMGV